jgi:uncharacterized protein (DUF2141 family)
MKKFLSNIFLIITIGLIVANCANRGTPSGGEKDILPPEITKSSPENFSVNFNEKEIRINFNEYVKIKNLQKQLIISPPMEPEPEVTPLGSASKYITIKIYDTLSPNTTYAFNFGESIVDNNEENPYPYYKYVFSTGSYIDSLTVKGKIIDAVNRKPEEYVSVMLYEIDSNYTDSIIYKERPKYITNTLDSTVNFSIENLKTGKYLMIALKDENSNYTFQQKIEKIGFLKSFITVPNDTIYEIKLFKEELDFKATRPRLISGQKIAFGFEGDYKNMLIKLLSKSPSSFKKRITKDPQTDSLMYWYKPKLEADSLLFLVENKKYVDTLTVKIKEMEKDSLSFKTEPRGTISFNENFTIQGSIPFISINSEKIKIIDKDSTKIHFTTNLDTLNNRYEFVFNKEESNAYKIEILPEAFTDFFDNKNDTLNYTLRTNSKLDYGNVRVTLQNVTYPVIVQLTDEKGVVKKEFYATKPDPINFFNVDPYKYLLRVIIDSNKNKKYDTGNYLKKIQPERVSYFPKQLDVRAGFDDIIDFTLE